MANEWAGHRINVNAIAPGYMATNNTQQLRDDAERSKAILDRIPAGRWGVRMTFRGRSFFSPPGRRITSAAIRWR
jgi:2-deoxy-D-gluconate 3-dehydrogenase